MYLIQMVVIILVYNPFIPNFSFRNYSYGIPSARMSKQIQPKSLPNIPEPTVEISEESQKLDRSQENSALLEVFGIKLFFDDILILCLIFFLYSEGIKDEMLFISLILLLLS